MEYISDNAPTWPVLFRGLTENPVVIEFVDRAILSSQCDPMVKKIVHLAIFRPDRVKQRKSHTQSFRHDDVAWESLEDAYGPATGVPRFVRSLASDAAEDRAWVISAGFAARGKACAWWIESRSAMPIRA